MNRQRVINLRWLLLSLAIIIIDLLTKFLVAHSLYQNQTINVTSFFNLTLAHNPGAAFSFLASAGGWQRFLFMLISTIVSIFLICWIYILPPKKKWQATALAFILGGAIGNLIDRVAHGYVIDFLDFHYTTYHWPAFNFADTMVVTGTIMLLIAFLQKD